jgi:acyl-CoA reductase-like NAD-dependent aldehyde dehydrogenase
VEAGFPPGVLNVVNGSGSVGAAIARHMDIQKLSFTGSVAVAKKIAALASGSNLKKVTFELGGKSPSIIFPDANLDVAIAWCTRSITDSSGQACVASSRVYVHEDIKAEFLQRFKESFEKIHGSYGDPFDENKTNGPIVDRSQHSRVLDLVESGKQQATLVTGGAKMLESGCFVQPTIFADAQPDAKVYKQEVFGPVVVVNSFRDEDEVIEKANDTDYGLSGAVFTQDINRAMRVAAEINSGTVGVNCCGMIDPQVPFGGFKQSGIGRELGKYGWLDYTETKTVFINVSY